MPTVSGLSGILECSHCGADHHHCPKCSDGWLVEKHGRYGDFFSCVRYPDCTGKASVAEIRAREIGQVGSADELRLAASRPGARKQ
ncbi:topoisomerase DNA-binding C4 zinc finger domain-containing protein [Rhodobacter capsulatus]|uniref:topoisomerase DNA-binding C4 zinc finger domain-containing protein n=1 Tax=Rhodobacter capsulatus TaxID=1061 RepID=UPI00402613B6